MFLKSEVLIKQVCAASLKYFVVIDKKKCSQEQGAAVD
jgi:hypothetical protein